MPHNEEINTQMEIAGQNCYETSVTPLLNSSFHNWETFNS